MSEIKSSAIKAELAKRKAPNQFDISKLLFSEQLAFIDDPAPYTTACCSRRAGKTEAIVYDLLREATSKAGVTALYLTLSRSNAKRLVWSKLINLNRKYKLGGQENISELSLTFPNKSVIYVSGAKDKAAIEKYRGLSLSLCYIDEAQSFNSFIKELVDDVITKALYDHNGKLKLTGTPPPVPSGFFFDACHNAKWSHHKWTMHQNPYLIQKGNTLTVDDLIRQDCERKGCELDDPSIRRECFGEWVTDFNALVLQYREDRNNYAELPPSQEKLTTVIGIDTGFNDSDAIAVIGWFDDHPEAFLIEEIVQPKQGWEKLSEQIRALTERYDPTTIVYDPANGAKKWAEDINARFGLSLTVAEKARKLEFLELLNDALKSGRFKAKANSQFAQDAAKLEWTFDLKTQKRKISDRYHSDAIDSTLYAFRASQFWLFKPAVSRPQVNSNEWFEEQRRKMEADAIAAYHRKHDPFHFDPSDF